MSSNSIILFDGVCNLCNGAVQFIIRHEKTDELRFASLQSAIAGSILQTETQSVLLPDSVVLYDNGKTYFRSSAAIRISSYLKFPFCLFYVFIIVPAPIRDIIYDFIASRRYRWFGKKESCMVPTTDIKSRFLD